MSATLYAAANSLETAANEATIANAGAAGYWSRMATASEVLAGATTSANSTVSGYMLRTALALESIAGTDGSEENENYSGLLKRIVDALEVQAGAVASGSLEYRFMVAAANAEFESGPVNLFPDPDLNDASSWTQVVGTSLAFTSSEIVATNATATHRMSLNDSAGKLTALNTAFIPDGEYLITVTLSSWTDGNILFNAGGGTTTVVPSGTGETSAILIVGSSISPTEIFHIRGSAGSDWAISAIRIETA